VASRRRNSGAAAAPTATGIDVADSLLAALALVLVVEGLMPLFAPRAWRDGVRRVAELSDGQLRFLGLVAIAIGLLAYAWLAA
jgi:uncharacterized protein YjeT (DUF2065 family)